MSIVSRCMKISLPKSENQYIEFKSERASAKDLADEMVGFANGEGGEIWLGVEDDGKVSGLSKSYEEDVMNIARTTVIPPIHPTYQEHTIARKKVAKISVPKGVDRPYYTSKNRYYIRIGSTKRVASREELIRLFQASGLFHFDLIELSNSTPKHLNYSEIADYFNHYQINFLEETEEEKNKILQASDILGKQGHPTVGGILVFGISPEKVLPQAGMDYAHYDGTVIDAKLLDKKKFGGSLLRQIDNTMAALHANLTIPSTILGTKRHEVAHYPDKVFRELLVNAAVHRNYSITGSVVRVFHFADRIEFISPGRLPNTVTIEKLKVGTSYARNPLLVRLMENLGYMDKLGRGLPMVHQEAVRLNKTVEFVETGEEFRVILQL